MIMEMYICCVTEDLLLNSCKLYKKIVVHFIFCFFFTKLVLLFVITIKFNANINVLYFMYTFITYLLITINSKQ